MQLSPLAAAKASSPSYPVRRNRLPGWLRRAALGAVAVLAMGLTACEGSPLDPDPVPPPGFGPMPSAPFVCGEVPPETLSTIVLFETNEGSLCGEQAAWAAIEVDQAARYRLALAWGEGVTISLFDPAGEHVAQLDAEHLELVVELTPGRWTVAALADDPEVDPAAYFGLSVSPVEQ
jgi:hypothetical protein